MKLYTLTDIGIQRKENQDNYWSAILDVDGVETGVVCLCDGMGGLENGGLASRMVVESVKDFFSYSVDITELSDVVKQSNKAIYELSEGKMMGTTCTILVCMQGGYDILHIGDSRCYKESNGRVDLLTTDHSALNKYKVTIENKELFNKLKGKLTRCIGVRDSVVLDYYSGNYKSGDRFLVCSDGFWHYFNPELLVGGKCVKSLEVLVKEYIRKGETDNITVGVLEV